METEALIEEIKSDLSKYDDAGLIDENSVYRDIVQGLKRFGNDYLVLQETVVEVVNGEATLPDNFKSLYVAYLCEPLGYELSPKIEQHSLQSSLFYRERITRSSKWYECDPCCIDTTENLITENLYFNGNNVKFHYHRPQLLSLGKTFHKNNIHDSCRNKLVRDNINEIIITGFRLKANFIQGDIYMQYYGLPLDKNGLVEIPESFNGHLETYLEYYAKRRLAERLMGNNDAQGLKDLFSVYKAEEQIALRNASNERKMGLINPKTLGRLRRLNKLESRQFEVKLWR